MVHKGYLEVLFNMELNETLHMQLSFTASVVTRLANRQTSRQTGVRVRCATRLESWTVLCASLVTLVHLD